METYLNKKKLILATHYYSFSLKTWRTPFSKSFREKDVKLHQQTSNNSKVI